MHIRFVKIGKNHYHLQIRHFYGWTYKKISPYGEFTEIMDFNSEKEGLKYIKREHEKDTTFFIYPTIKLK